MVEDRLHWKPEESKEKKMFPNRHLPATEAARKSQGTAPPEQRIHKSDTSPPNRGGWEQIRSVRNRVHAIRAV